MIFMISCFLYGNLIFHEFHNSHIEFVDFHVFRDSRNKFQGFHDFRYYRLECYDFHDFRDSHTIF